MNLDNVKDFLLDVKDKTKSLFVIFLENEALRWLFLAVLIALVIAILV